MIELFIAWIILFITFITYGDLFSLVWKKLAKTSETYTLYDKFWLGMALLGALCMYISLFLPLSFGVLLIVLIYPIIFFIRNYRSLARAFKEYFTLINESSLLVKISFILLALTIILYSLFYPTLYDLGLYHLQTMSWAEQYPVVKGLGNLHGRLAFNSSGLLLNTLFSYHPNFYHTFFSINSLSLLVFSLWIFKNFIFLSGKMIKLALVLVLGLVIFEFGDVASSTSTDFLPQLLIISLFLKWIFSLQKNTQTSFLQSHLFLIVVFTSFCLTLKLSAVIIILVLFLSFFYTLKENKWRIGGLMLICGFFFAIPWLSRFVILSGYLIYPYPNIDLFSFDWKMPIYLVELEKDLAYTWARLPHLDMNEVKAMPLWQWFPLWARRIYRIWIVLYGLAIIASLFSIVKSYRSNKNEAIFISIISLLGILFNLLTAPDLRFVLGFVTIALITPISLSSYKISASKITDYSLLICCLFLLYKCITTTSFNFELKQLITIQNYSSRTSKEFDSYLIKDQTFYYPKNSNQCFDKELPCLPELNNNIELRGNDLRDGFKTK